ncbi:MAG: hypothetical protein V4662_25120 [Verrucomicrobiota bacterium]
MKLTLSKNAILAAASFISTDETRYVLNGIHVGLHQGALVMVATDGRRMIIIQELRVQEGIPEDWKGIIFDPSPLLLLMDHFCLKHLDAIVFELSENGKTLMVVNPFDENTVLGCPVVNGVYPNWLQVVPSDTPQASPALSMSMEFMEDAKRALEALNGDRSDTALIFPCLGSKDAELWAPILIRPGNGDYAHRCLMIIMPRKVELPQPISALPGFLQSKKAA